MSSLRALDELNLSFTQQMQIIMKAECDDQAGEKDRIETTESNLELSELLDAAVKAVNVARQDNFPYLQHPGKIIYLKKVLENSPEAEEGGEDAGDRHVALAQDCLRVPHSLPLLARMLTDHRDDNYRLAIRSTCREGS